MAGSGCVWNIEDVQFALRGLLKRIFGRRIVGDVVSIDDVVVPISLAWLHHRRLEAERAFPGAGFAGFVARERKLAAVVVP